MNQRAHWRIVAEKYPCEFEEGGCGAGPGEPCLTPSGHHADTPHVVRTRKASANHWEDPDEQPLDHPA